MKQLHLLMCILLLLSSLLVILSNNPVESVLYLILTFCNAGTILFLFNLEFFGLIFIIIYVGAIAVLFLFVVMMINIKQESFLFTNSNTSIFFFSTILILTLYIVLLNLYLCLFESVPNLQNINVLPDSVFNTAIDNLTNIEVFGQVLYNFFLFYVPIAGFLLLIALIGSIVLTLNFNRQAKQTFSYKQLARTDNFISFFSNKNIKK